ncbi:MAG: ABC transporter ATP-binding protein [Bacteroidota bacterium]
MAGKNGSDYQPPKRKLNKSSWQQVKKIYSYLRPYKWQYAFGLILLSLTGFIALAVPTFMGEMAGSLIDKKTTDIVMELGGLNLEFDSVNQLLLILGIILLVQSVISFFRVYIFAWVSENMMIHLRADTFKKIISMPMEWFNAQRVGDLNSRISADISSIQETFTTTTAELLRQSIIVVFGIALLFVISWELAMYMLAVIPLVIIVAAVFGRYIRKLSKATQNAVSNSNVVVEETFTSIINVKAFANEGFEFLRYMKDIKQIKSIGLKAAIWRGAFAAFIILFIFGAITFIVWKGASLVEADNQVNTDDFLTFIILTTFIGGSIGGLPIQYAAFQRGLGAIENVLGKLALKEEDVSTDENIPSISLKGDLAFENIHFAYSTRSDVPVLKGIEFSIPAGKTIALVGGSGSGKSTIASLILQLYPPNEGSILFDGKNADEYTLQGLRNQMAFVPQEVLLFGGSIRENIAYGKTNASDEEILAAAKKANALEFIEKFPDGLDTVVGERGIQLSGGQRQRIAIARAVLKNPTILVLDEATSALDSESESLVQQALDVLMEGRTSIVIAHRLSTIRNADEILVLEAGKIVERGTHGELIQNEQGVYKHLSTLQFELA